MSLFDEITLYKIMEMVLKDADQIEEDAAYGGFHNDGGARLLREQVSFYKMGQNGTFPTAWKKYEIKLDPNYNTYIKLKEKFEGD